MFKQISLCLLLLVFVMHSAHAKEAISNPPIPSKRPSSVSTAAPIEPNEDVASTNPSNRLNACLVELQKIAEAKSIIQPTPKDPDCKIPNPVSIISIRLQTGQITLPKDMLNDCKFALEFSHWLADVANPLAEQHLGSSIKRLHSGTGFTCRRRNNLPTGKLSEHAFGNAIDIIGLTLKNGDRFLVDDPTQMAPSYARFFAALRKTACGYFTTVLGPGANAAHATHLHLDLAVHGRTGKYRICE